MNYSLAEMELIIRQLEFDNFNRIREDFEGKYHTSEFRDQLRKEIELLEKIGETMREVDDERSSK